MWAFLTLKRIIQVLVVTCEKVDEVWTVRYVDGILMMSCECTVIRAQLSLSVAMGLKYDVSRARWTRTIARAGFRCS